MSRNLSIKPSEPENGAPLSVIPIYQLVLCQVSQDNLAGLLISLETQDPRKIIRSVTAMRAEGSEGTDCCLVSNNPSGTFLYLALTSPGQLASANHLTSLCQSF